MNTGARRRRACNRMHCDQIAVLGGLCNIHVREQRAAQQLRDTAIHLLHFGEVDSQVPSDKDLRNELTKLQGWWFRACDAVNFGRDDDILADEAEYALEWCIRLAEQIALAERAHRIGDEPGWSLQSTRNWVWQRFANLEAGRMSNGVERHA